MQTLPIATQAVASKSSSTRTGKSGSDASDFLPTLNKAEAKTATRTERSDTSRSSAETASRDNSRQETKTRRQDNDHETRQARRDKDSEPSSAQEATEETASKQEVTQTDDTQEAQPQDVPDKDGAEEVDEALNAMAAVAPEAETLPTEELGAAQGGEAEAEVAEVAVDGETAGEDLPAELTGPRVHEEQRQQAFGQDRAAEVKAAQATPKASVVEGGTEVEPEVLDDAQLAQKIKKQLMQPASVKAESVQVAAQTMGQMKNAGQVQVEVVDGVNGLNAQSEEASGKITDPRFASLLNRQDVETVLRQRQTPAQVAANSNGLSANAGEKMAETLLNATTADAETTAEMPTAKPNAAVESLIHRVANDASNTVDAHAGVAHTAHQQATGTTTSTFALGQRQPVNVPDSHIVNQTVEHLSIHARGDSSSVTVRLHPEELGELQLRMVMEGDQLKVHLHAQSQQVQDVLERNFPRLRDALQDQGLTVEDFQVSVDSGSAEQQQSFSQHGQNAGRGPVAVTMDADMMAQVAEVVPGVAIDSSQGISVRI